MNEAKYEPEENSFESAAQIAELTNGSTKEAASLPDREQSSGINQGQSHEIRLPAERETFEQDGVKYQFEKVSTGTQAWNNQSGRMEPKYYSLRSWFSHFTDGIGPGPGWDLRLSLENLSENEMLQRYGHVFSTDEISSPGGKLVRDEYGEKTHRWYA